MSVTGSVAETLEGAQRGRAHFDGVATVVTKLLLARAARCRLLRREGRAAGRVLRRLTADLNMPVELVVCPTSRDEDGLARSSRNARLSAR